MDFSVCEDQITQISFICPDVDPQIIRNDLLITKDVDVTVNRILDGTVYRSSFSSGIPQPDSDYHPPYYDNSDSDTELPPASKVLSYQHIGGNTAVTSNENEENKKRQDKVDLVEVRINNENENNKRRLDLLNSVEDGESSLNLENCGSLRNRLLGTNLCGQLKELKNEVGIVNVQNVKTYPITLTDSSNDSCESANASNNKLNRVSPLTISDNSRDAYQNNMSSGDNSDSEIEIHATEQEPLSKLIKKFNNDSVLNGNLQEDNSRRLRSLSPDPHVQSSISNSQGSLGESENVNHEVPVKKVKRNKEEIEQRKREAQALKSEKEKEKLQKKLVKEEQLAQKEREKQIKNAERERKKQMGINSLSYLKVIVDPHIVNECGLGAAIYNVCEKLGVSCHTEEQRIPYTVCWKRSITECALSDKQVEKIETEVVEDEVLSILPLSDFVEMVNTFKQKQLGNFCEGKTLREYVHTVQAYLIGKIVTLIVIGMEKYFRDQKTMANRQHKDAVRGTDPAETTKKQKKKTMSTVVSRVDVEEAVTDTQLQTNSMVYMMETGEDVAEFIRTYTKAVAEKHAKKDRLTSVFSFYEEGTTGVKVDKSGHGLLKVWKQQFLQFKNISPDVAEALIRVYPSPWLLREAYRNCTSEKEAIKLIENIVVRRGAGVLETTRRVGKELSRRIYTAMTCTDPTFVIK